MQHFSKLIWTLCFLIGLQQSAIHAQDCFDTYPDCNNVRSLSIEEEGGTLFVTIDDLGLLEGVHDSCRTSFYVSIIDERGIAVEEVDGQYALTEGYYDVIVGWAFGFCSSYLEVVNCGPDSLAPILEAIDQTIVLSEISHFQFVSAWQFVDLIDDDCGISRVEMSINEEGTWSAFEDHRLFEELGTYPVVIRATDHVGNQAYDTVTLTVATHGEGCMNDITPPVVEGIDHAQFFVEADELPIYLYAYEFAGNSYDDCAIVSFQIAFQDETAAGNEVNYMDSLAIHEEGEYHLSLRAIDSAGNEGYGEAFIGISIGPALDCDNDSTAPYIIRAWGPGVMVLPEGEDSLVIDFEDLGVHAIDDCSEAIAGGMSLDQENYFNTLTLGVGVHSVYALFSDSSGNEVVTEVLMRVSADGDSTCGEIDVFPPVVVTEDYRVVELTASGTLTLAADFFDGGSYDNCAIASRQIALVEDFIYEEEPVHNFGDSITLSLPGFYNVILRITDSSGNSADRWAFIEVQGDIIFPPVPFEIISEFEPVYIDCETYEASYADNLEAALSGDEAALQSLDSLLGSLVILSDSSVDPGFNYYGFTYNTKYEEYFSYQRTVFSHLSYEDSSIGKPVFGRENRPGTRLVDATQEASIGAIVTSEDLDIFQTVDLLYDECGHKQYVRAWTIQSNNASGASEVYRIEQYISINGVRGAEANFIWPNDTLYCGELIFDSEGNVMVEAGRPINLHPEESCFGFEVSYTDQLMDMEGGVFRLDREWMIVNSCELVPTIVEQTIILNTSGMDCESIDECAEDTVSPVVELIIVYDGHGFDAADTICVDDVLGFYYIEDNCSSYEDLIFTLSDNGVEGECLANTGSVQLGVTDLNGNTTWSRLPFDPSLDCANGDFESPYFVDFDVDSEFNASGTSVTLFFDFEAYDNCSEVLQYHVSSEYIEDPSEIEEYVQSIEVTIGDIFDFLFGNVALYFYVIDEAGNWNYQEFSLNLFPELANLETTINALAQVDTENAAGLSDFKVSQDGSELRFFATFNKEMDEDLTIQIFDIQGRQIDQFGESSPLRGLNEWRRQLNVTPGLYIARLVSQAGHSLSSEKFIIH